jgi:hypothetical protein
LLVLRIAGSEPARSALWIVGIAFAAVAACTLLGYPDDPPGVEDYGPEIWAPDGSSFAGLLCGCLLLAAVAAVPIDRWVASIGLAPAQLAARRSLAVAAVVLLMGVPLLFALRSGASRDPHDRPIDSDRWLQRTTVLLAGIMAMSTSMVATGAGTESLRHSGALHLWMSAGIFLALLGSGSVSWARPALVITSLASMAIAGMRVATHPLWAIPGEQWAYAWRDHYPSLGELGFQVATSFALMCLAVFPRRVCAGRVHHASTLRLEGSTDLRTQASLAVLAVALPSWCIVLLF